MHSQYEWSVPILTPQGMQLQYRMQYNRIHTKLSAMPVTFLYNTPKWLATIPIMGQSHYLWCTSLQSQFLCSVICLYNTPKWFTAIPISEQIYNLRYTIFQSQVPCNTYQLGAQCLNTIRAHVYNVDVSRCNTDETI